MSRMTPITTHHEMILEGLDVLLLMVDRLELEEFVEPDDITAVLNFLGDVGCKCLEHTEQLLLRPALVRSQRKDLASRLKTAISCHETVKPLFEDAISDIPFRKSFIMHAHLLTKVVGDLILEEDDSLLQEAIDLLNDTDGNRNVDEFAEREERIHEIA